MARRQYVAAFCAVIVIATSIAPAVAQRKGGTSPLIPGGNSKAPISIDAARLEYFDNEQKFVYSGNVVAKQGDATLKAPTMTIFLTKDAVKNRSSGNSEGAMNDQIRRIETTGPVTVTSKDQVGTGDRGIYDKQANKVFLIGHPVLTQGPNIVRGSADGTLEYDLNTGRANIKGGRVQSIFTPSSNEKKGSKPRPKQAGDGAKPK